MDEASRRQYLQAMGVTVWQRRDGPLTSEASTVASVSTETSAAVADDNSRWGKLAERVRTCTACSLHQGRTQTVLGVGNKKAQWLVIGEAPGAEEDRQGEPFVGPAGKLLNEMLFAVGLKRGEVYIANIVKCRPPQNREPAGEEAGHCAPYLREQIDLIQPKVILCVGKVAANNLLGNVASLASYRGRTHRFADTDIPVVVTYHPAYLLRNPLDKRWAWEDLNYAISVLQTRLASQ
jgi:DNA polymerase